MGLKEAIPGELASRMPVYQSAILRHVVAPIVDKHADFEKSSRSFERINRNMLEILNQIPSDKWNERVRVPHQLGVEEDSRDFSAIMVIEHVLIAAEFARSIVLDMAMGLQVDRLLHTPFAAPRGERTPEQIIEDFEQLTETCMSELAPFLEKADLSLTVDHPWYGPFNVKQWHWLLAGHSMIHYRQLKNIQSELARRSI